jgi:hypothetical protein
MRFNSCMRRLLANLAPVLALAIALIACAAPARPAPAACAHASIAVAQSSADAARFEATASSAPRSGAAAQDASDPAADPDPDNLGSDREAPEALPALDGTGIEAPQGSRIELRSTYVEAAASRETLPTVQPPRG